LDTKWSFLILKYKFLYLAQGTVNISATYNTRHSDFESSVVARGGLWRLESSRGSLNSGNDSSPLFLIQLGPLLFVRDSTLLLPIHLSKQYLLWYGYDRKVLVFPSFGLTLFSSYMPVQFVFIASLGL
jgi:hypothetical protein